MSNTLDSSPSPSNSSHLSSGARAKQRPYHEPSLLDYSRYEEGGHMYYALNRHPKSTSTAEEWYEETDAHIEHDVLENYQHYVRFTESLAKEEGDEESEKFYRGLGGVLKEDVLEAYEERSKILMQRYEARETVKRESDGTVAVWKWEKEKKQWEVVRQKSLDESFFQTLKESNRVRKPNESVFYDEIEIFTVTTEENGKNSAIVSALNDVNGISPSLSSRKVQEREASQPPGSQDHSIESKELPQSGAKANEEEELEVVVPDWGFYFVFT